MGKSLLVKIVTSSLLLLLSFGNLVSAESSFENETDSITTTLKIDNKVTIEKFQDGRVKGIEDVGSLTDNQKKEILEEMRFTNEEIKKLPPTVVDDIITEGGIKVQIEQKNMKHIYTSLDGVDYIVTEENKKFVEDIRNADRKKLGLENFSTSSMGEVEDGGFSGFGSLIYHGKVNNNKEFKYSFATNFNWSKPPFFSGKDKVAVAYETYATRTGAMGHHYTRLGDVGVDISYGSVYGITGSTPTAMEAGTYGYLSAEVNIPVSEQGNAGMFTSGYGHSWTVVPISVSIGPASISFSGAGDKWDWDNYFTIGKAY